MYSLFIIANNSALYLVEFVIAIGGDEKLRLGEEKVHAEI